MYLTIQYQPNRVRSGAHKIKLLLEPGRRQALSLTLPSPAVGEGREPSRVGCRCRVAVPALWLLGLWALIPLLRLMPQNTRDVPVSWRSGGLDFFSLDFRFYCICLLCISGVSRKMLITWGGRGLGGGAGGLDRKKESRKALEGVSVPSSPPEDLTRQEALCVTKDPSRYNEEILRPIYLWLQVRTLQITRHL